MSKLDKFIDQPRGFFKDAFKKRETKIAHQLDSINSQLKKIRFPLQLNIKTIEQNFVETAVTLSHTNILSGKIVQIINIERQYQKETQYSELSGLAVMRHRFKYLFKHINSAPPNKQVGIKNQDLANLLNSLSPEAKAIYLQLKRKSRTGGDN